MLWVLVQTCAEGAGVDVLDADTFTEGARNGVDVGASSVGAGASVVGAGAVSVDAVGAGDVSVGTQSAGAGIEGDGAGAVDTGTVSSHDVAVVQNYSPCLRIQNEVANRRRR